jgi:hypothetical protein
MCDPICDTAKTDNVLPSRHKDLTLRLDPNSRLSKIDRLEPIRQIPYAEQVEPSLKQDLTLRADP